MPSFRAWITGLGVVSAAGVGVEETLASFREGRRNVGPVTLFPTSLHCPVFEARILQADGAVHDHPSRTVRLAMSAVTEALEASGNPHRDKGLRIGVCLGTTVASQLNNLEFYEAYRRTAHPPLAAVEDFLKANLAEAVAQALDVRGPRATLVNACSSGTDAIGLGLSWLRAGLCDLVIAGGADELNLVPLCGFHSLGIVSDSPCAPFDLHRSGLNLGEGAGILVLETDEARRKRGREARLLLAGYGAACDAYHLTAPHPDGLGIRSAIMGALQQAETAPGEIAFVNAHGTATPDNDRVEGNALGGIFGRGLAVLSTKGYTGHTLGAAGGIEAVFTALGLQERWVPASAGFETPDPDIPIAPLRGRTSMDGCAAMSTSLAFGGNNAALVIRRAG
jgi:3-oxoacyl-(acyl-carrier-protein) synthase